jgi:hypothetical protein
MCSVTLSGIVSSPSKVLSADIAGGVRFYDVANVP